MNAPEFTPGQRRTVILMVIAVITVFAMLTGFVVTSLQNWETPLPATPQTFASSPPTPTPPPLPSPSPSPMPEEGLWSQVQAARLFDQIAHQVEVLRGLSPRAEVPLSFLDEHEMTVLLRQLYTERDPEARLSPYTTLGLLPDLPIYIRPHQPAGIYVPEQRQLYIVTGPHENSADAQALLARAYARALQDQHFDLTAMDARAATTDATLAIQSLVEGDTALLMALYRHEDLNKTDWDHLTELALSAGQPSYGEKLDAVEAWTRLQRFPYWEGRRFTHDLLQIGGWEAVNQAYTTPPRSTEQVLHPERYLEREDRPTEVMVPDLGTDLGEGWTKLRQDTLGEFVVGLYLDTVLPEEMSWQAAAGWDGDTLVVWERDEESRVLVWRTIWDSNADAAEFERALVAWIPQRHPPVRPADPPGPLSGQWWETDAGAMCVSRVARYVTLVQTPDVNTMANVVEIIP